MHFPIVFCGIGICVRQGFKKQNLNIWIEFFLKFLLSIPLDIENL